MPANNQVYPMPSEFDPPILPNSFGVVTGVPRWTTLEQLRRNPELVRRLLAALRTSDGPARRTTRHFQSGL